METKNLSEVIGLMKKIGGKYIIVEDGRPSFVMMSMKEYKDLFQEEEEEEFDPNFEEWKKEQMNRSWEEDDLNNDVNSNDFNDEPDYYDINDEKRDF